MQHGRTRSLRASSEDEGRSQCPRGAVGDGIAVRPGAVTSDSQSSYGNPSAHSLIELRPSTTDVTQ
jgi:hypothetical protein